MKTLITRIKRLALALCFVTPLVSWAETKTNPVTGETETYSNVFTGETAEWDSAENWTLKEEGKVPFVSGGNYDPALVDGKTVSTSTAIDGWNLQVGAYNGAAITWSTLGKIQGDTGMWLTVDGTSSIAINGWSGGNLGQDGKTLSYYVANKDGVIWNVDLDSGWDQGLTMNYYLAGTGSVSYQKLERAAQVIKQADVALSGNEKSVQSKTLVSFTSTDKTFTADAAIKVKNGDNVLKTVYLTSVTADATTLTTDDDVGACELVQTSTGIVLYYVDGDPADVVVEEKTYKPSININFTNGAANGLTTGADVGLSGYEVPGTSWNNYVVGNSTFSSVNAIDSTGAASAMSGVSVTISNVSGSWSCSGLTASSDFRQSYIDESAAKSTPTVTVTGIPYYKYRVLVYHSTDTANVPFGYDTINGTDYTYEKDALSEGSTAWGNSGPQNGANAIAEGGNVLVTEALSGSTLTVVGHRAGGANNARGCIAAIQIIEVKADVGENDLEIAVDGEKEYTVTAEDAEKTGTVYLTGSGTLTLAGENKISAATIEIGGGVTLVVNADRLDATTFTGAGTVVYDGTKPASGKGWTDPTWTGTVWVKNIPTDSNERKDWDLALYGNADSTLRFTGVNLYFPNNTTTTFLGTVDIDGEGMNVCDGYGGSIATFARLTGSGTLSTTGGSSNGNGLTINDASGFTGTITLTKYKVIVGTSTGTSASGVLQIESGKSITVAGATAPGGFVVNGTLVANGTLASSATAAVTGSGTVTFGGVPSPVDGENETKWWKNAGWTGTVEIKGASIAGNTYAFNDYGNASSTVKLTNCSGWLTGDYTCVPALEIGGTFSWNDGWSGTGYTFKVGTLKGSGTISIPNQGAATAVWQITDDWSGFTGAVVGNNTAAKRVLVFGSTLPSSVTAGEIYISEGATLNLDNASSAWWGVGMKFVVDGTVKATNRSKWGGGTAMELGSTGVLEITRADSASDDDGGTDYSNVTGTGTIKFSGSGFTVLSQSIPTSLTFAAEKASGSVVPVAGATIGSLTGSKGFRSDWGNNGEDGRYLTIKQSKDTVWEGLITVGGTHRLTGVVVDPGASTTGTLTLTATQTASSTLTVNGSVNLTGTWVGATTVAGTFGGTGTLTGDLTFSDGATFKAFAADEDGLAVSGTVTCPAEGTVTVDVSAIEPETDVALLKAADLDATKFALAEGAPEGATLEVVEGVLTLVVPPATVDITITPVANATASVTVNGTPVTPVEGVVTVEIGATVVVTYTANDGYMVTGSPVEFTATADTTAVDTEGVTTKAYVAWIYDENGDLVGTPYTDEMMAVGAFLQIGTGESIRFLAQSTFHDMLLAACTYDGETFTYTRKPAEPTVATITIGEKVYEYSTLAAAVAEGQNATIVLVDDIDLTGENENITIPATKSDAAFVTTLDLNGHSIAGDNDGDIRVLGTLTLKDTAANSEGRIYSTTDYATGHETGLVLVQESGVFNMQSGAIVAVRETPADNGQFAVIVAGNGTVNVSGGTITAGWYAIGANNQQGSAMSVNITGGTLVSTTDYALYVVGNMTVNISGAAAVSGAAGMAGVRNGNLTITGGTFATSGDGDVGSWTDGTATLSPTKALINFMADYAVSSVTISGGSFTAASSANCFSFGAKAKEGSSIVVTGGSFSSDPSEYVAAGYEATEDAGVWTVAEVQEVPVTPGAQTEPVDSEAEAEAEAAKVVPSVPAAVAEALSDDQETAYKALFEPKVVEVPGATTQYAVEVVLKEEVVTEIQTVVDTEAEDLAKAAVEAAADAVAGGEATVTTKPGLYYVVEAGSELDGIEPASCTLATSESTALPVPNKGAKGFYKIRVSVTPVDVE